MLRFKSHSADAVSTKPPRSLSAASLQGNQQSHSASESFRELLDSLSTEQSCNQKLLASLAFALRSFTNLHRFLELVPIVASRLVGVEGALLVPFQVDGRIWRDLLQSLPFDQNHELLRQIASMEAGLNIGFGADPKKLEMMDRMVQRHMIKASIFTTSVVARGKQRGRLYVFDTQSAFPLSDIHRRHLQLVADLAGVAIENDQTLQEIRRHERVDRQLSIGAEIQAQLLPDRCPVIEGVELAARCRPAFQVGGDYYDFMSMRPELIGSSREKSRWAFVIGDVMGKGVPACLLMTMLRGMLRAEVLSGLPPDRILHDLNQLAQVDLEHSHRFVTLFYSDFDPGTRRLRYANAAHNPPLLWRAAQRSVSRLDAPGLLIGLQFDANYGCGSIILEPGDVLLYYTDGVTEAPGLAGDRFGEARLISTLEDACKNALAAQEILDKLFSRLDRFVGIDHQLEDDASMVLLKINDGLTLPTIK